ncbi:hypothetical protein [Oceanobacillus sp. CAU 1775]
MDDNRITVIVNEIEYWREHKILPEQQCDFLLALYTQGEELPKEKLISRKHSNLQLSRLTQLVLLVLLVPMAFLILYFTEFNLYYKIIALSLFLSYSIWMFITNKKHKTLSFHLSLMISLLLILLICLLVTTLFFENPFIISIIIVLNFIVWYIIGRRFKLVYLLITSILGIIFTGLYLFI